MWEVWLGSGLFKGALNWCSSSTSTMTNALINDSKKNTYRIVDEE